MSNLSLLLYYWASDPAKKTANIILSSRSKSMVIENYVYSAQRLGLSIDLIIIILSLWAYHAATFLFLVANKKVAA